MTLIHVHGGLANRLRAIVSWKATVGPITVAWKPDGQVAFERFTDAFKPLDGVTFIDNAAEATVSTYEPHPNAPKGWERGYLDLEPISVMPVGAVEYAAIHMRRTDAIAYQVECGLHESDGVFLDWCLSQPCRAVFVAADNGTTQRLMVDALERSGRRALTHGPIKERPDQDEPEVRNTGLVRAVWDIQACVGAKFFRGSGASSYTNLIHTLRGLR